MAVTARRDRPGQSLPAWGSLLAVVAHPGDESFGLGGLLHLFRTMGTRVHLLVLTYDSAPPGRSPSHRPRRAVIGELQAAADILGIATTDLPGLPAGGLSGYRQVRLAAHVRRAARQHRVHGLVVFDETGVTGHPDHRAATTAAVAFADAAGLPVLAWAVPVTVAAAVNRELGNALLGRPLDQLDLCVRVNRTAQRRAALAHPNPRAWPVLWHRLQLLGDCEYVRWLRRTAPQDGAAPPDGAAPSGHAARPDRAAASAGANASGS